MQGLASHIREKVKNHLDSYSKIEDQIQELTIASMEIHFVKTWVEQKISTLIQEKVELEIEKQKCEKAK